MAAANTVGTGRKILATIFQWEIPNYSTCSSLQVGEHITSPVFYAQGSQWYLKMCPKKGVDEKTLALYLYLADESASILVRYSFTVLNHEKRVIYQFTSKNCNLFNARRVRYGCKNIIRYSNALAMLGGITILCEIFPENDVTEQALSAIGSGQAFESFINNAQFSDVKLLVEGKEISAHKIILAANSPVFAAMFQHNMRENKDDSVAIEDISYEVFRELLRFIYTGESQVTEGIVSRLFSASDKYQLLKLKDQCEKEMCTNLSIDNAIEYLVFADMHSAQSMKKKAIDFIVCRGQEIINKPEFDTLRNLNAELFKEVFHSIFTRRPLQDNVNSTN